MLTRKKKQTAPAFLVSIVVHVAIAAALTAIVLEEHLQETDVEWDIDVHVDPPETRDPIVRRDRDIERNPVALKDIDVNLPTRDVNINPTGIRTDIQIPSGSSDLIQGPSELPDIPPSVNLPNSPDLGPIEIGPPEITSAGPPDSPTPPTELEPSGIVSSLDQGARTPQKREFEVDGDYYEKLRLKISGKQKYPSYALQANLEGETKIRFVLKRDGTLVSSEIAEESGYKSLDSAALQSVKSAAPFPPFPVAQKGDEISVVVPIVFELK